MRTLTRLICRAASWRMPAVLLMMTGRVRRRTRRRLKSRDPRETPMRQLMMDEVVVPPMSALPELLQGLGFRV